MIEPRVARLYAALGISTPLDEDFSFTLEGVDFEGRIDRGSKDSLEGAILWTALGAHLTAADITVRREGVLDRVGKRLRINREFRSADPDFDDACYIEGEVPDATLAALFGSAEVRRRTLALLRTGLFREIKIKEDDRVLFYVPSVDFGRGAELLTALVESRVLVSGLLAAHRSTTGTDVTTLLLPSRTPRIVGVVLFDLLGFVGYLALRGHAPPTPGYGPLQGALLVAFCLAHLVALIALFRGRANSLRLVVTFVVLGIAVDLLVATQVLPRLGLS